MKPEVRAELVEEIAEQMVLGWSYINRNEWRRKYEKEHGIPESVFKNIERDAKDTLTASWDQVSRQDLVARNLHRLEYIAREATKYKQLSVAQAAIATMNRSVGADRPADN